MIQISETDAKEWYETNGISSDSWDSLPEFQQQMIAVEAVADSWKEVGDMRETGIPESAVNIYFNSEAIGLDESEVEYHAESDGYESLTSYVLQNTNSENVRKLFDSESVTVLSVSYVTANSGVTYVTIECEGNDSIFN